MTYRHFYNLIWVNICIFGSNHSLNINLNSPGASLTPNSVTAKKSSFNRPKSAEPGSPLLRRALSPDRLHPPRCSNVDGKKNTTISPLCSPSCKVVVSTTPKLTISTQLSPQSVSHMSHKVSGEVSPLPTRALHTSPLAGSGNDARDPADQQGGVLLRKHSKQSLRYVCNECYG